MTHRPAAPPQRGKHSRRVGRPRRGAPAARRAAAVRARGGTRRDRCRRGSARRRHPSAATTRGSRSSRTLPPSSHLCRQRLARERPEAAEDSSERAATWASLPPIQWTLGDVVCHWTGRWHPSRLNQSHPDGRGGGRPHPPGTAQRGSSGARRSSPRSPESGERPPTRCSYTTRGWRTRSPAPTSARVLRNTTSTRAPCRA